MADAVTTHVLANTPTAYIVHLTNVCDGTGESGVKKVDIAALVNQYGVKPNGLRIQKVHYAINGFTSVVLAWDRTAAANTAVLLPGGYGKLCFEGVTAELECLALVDPSEGNADGKGSLLLTATQGKSASATYDITIWLAKVQNSTAT